MTPEKRALDLLDRAYENLKEVDELEAFLLCAKDYVEYIQKTPVFIAVIGELDGQKSKWMDELEGLEEKALNELETAEKFILPFAKEKPSEEDGHSFMFGVTGLRMYKEGKTNMAGLKPRNIEKFLFEIVKDLPQADKDKILKRYSDKNPVYQNIYGNFCFSESGKRLQERLSDFNIKRKVEVWGCWDFVKLIPKVIPALYTDNTMTRFAEQFSCLDQDLINEYVRLIMTIRNGEAMRNHNELVKARETIKEYKNYAARVNTYLLKEISEREPSGYAGKPAKSDLQILGEKLNEAFAADKTSIRASRAWFEALAKEKTDATPDKYKISVKDREIWVNEYLVGKPHAVGSNFEFFERVRSKPANSKINREELPNHFGKASLKEQVASKSFIKMLNEIGFKGEILKAFFYNRGKDTVTYRGDEITKKDLENAGIKIPLSLKELELAHTRSSPE